MFTKSLAVSILTLALGLLAHADVIGNGPPNQTGGSDLNGFLEGDNFTLGSASTISQVTFWALQGVTSDYAGSVEYGFYTDSSGAPGAALFSGSATPTGVATGNSTFGLNEFSYTFNVTAALTPGTYWLVLHNGPSSSQPQTDFYWAWSSATGNSQSLDLSSPGSGWVTNSAELAFQLQANAGSPVPEPASLCLVSAGVLTAYFKRSRILRKNRRSNA